MWPKICIVFLVMRMKRIIRIIILILAGFSSGGLQIASAEPLLLADEAMVLFDLINNARQNPLEVAASLGFDSEKLLSELPGLRNVLIGGLPALKMNEKLCGAALSHTEYMLVNGYCGHQSPNGSEVDERIKEWGYLAAASGESLAILGFYNFISPEDAINIIFKEMFIDELDPERIEKRNILGEDFDEVGVGVGAGILCLNGDKDQNVYLATCDFAKAVNYDAIELELLTLMNDARRSPVKAIIECGFTEEQIGEVLGDQGWSVLQELAPLAMNKQLHEAACGHNQDMIQRLYFDSINKDGLGPFDRITSAGYNAETATEAMVALECAKIESCQEIAGKLYMELIRKELASKETFGRSIFCAGVTEVGVAIDSTYIDMGDNGVIGFCIAVIDFALPVEPRAFLLGNIYRDLNDSQKFEKGEGVSGMIFSIKTPAASDGNKISVSSGLDGWYQIELGKGLFEYEIVSPKEGLLSDGIVIGNFMDVHNELKNWKIE